MRTLENRLLGGFSEPVHVVELDNGFTVIHIQRERELVYADFVIAGGSMDDVIEGEAHFLEHLTFGGRHRGGTHPLLKPFHDRLGIMESNAVTNPFCMSFHGKVWKKDAKAFIETLGEMVTHPDLGEEAILAEQGVIRAEIAGKASERELRELWLMKQIPSRRDIIHNGLGTNESIARITSDSLWQYHERIFTKTRCALITRGDLEIDSVVEWIAPFVERLPDDKPNARLRKEVFEPEVFGEHRITHKRQQSIELEFLHRGPSVGVETLLLNVVYNFIDDADYGVLFQKLRTERGLVYDVNRHMSGWPIRICGIQTKGIALSNIDEVQKIILDVMREVDLKTFDEERLDFIKRDYLMDEANNLDGSTNPDTLQNLWLQNRLFTYNRMDHHEAVAKLTPADLLEIHRKYWDPDRLLIIRSDPA